jgi:pyruvate-formate lyase-activating enzyme/SAM-dependent methyltransferase
MKALIKVGYGCNNHCTFCHTVDVRHIDGDSDEVERKIDRAARLGHTMVCLSGGEVTMRKELMRWASRVAARGMDFGLVTNGRMLAYEGLVEKLIERRLKYVYLSLHGGTAKVHNLLVRADAFEQTYGAIKNLAGRGLDFTVNTVVTRQNVQHLRGVVDAMLPYPDVVTKFSMVAPKGGADKLFEQIIPPVALVAEKVVDAIRYGLERTGGQGKYAHDGIPFCLLPGLEDRYDDLRTHRFATMVEIGEADFFPVDDRAKVQPDECNGCSLRGPCPGLFRGYREVHGDGEIKAVPGPRSNSFHYVREARVGRLVSGARRAGGSDCPVRADGVTPWDRGRHLFLLEGDTVWRYRCDSRDFPDVEIERTKKDLGQVYVDVSGRDAPQDFARDLAKAQRSRVCEGCPEEPGCAGMFERSSADLFTRDDGRVRDVVAGLRGDVLDVGCGEGRYGDVLGPLVGAGLVRYVGLEPDGELAARMREKWAWATVERGEAEGLDATAAYDHVLVLRSWNHLHDPERAVRAILKALRPGGTLTVVDDAPFGLLRDPEHAARAEGSSAIFEHHRNDGPTEAARVLSGTPLVPLDRLDVGPSTSTLWMLRYRAP